MTLHTWATLEGAAICIALGLLALTALLALIQHYRESCLWRRFAHACGGEVSALKMLIAAEASAEAATDVYAAHAFKTAQRRGYLPRDMK